MRMQLEVPVAVDCAAGGSPGEADQQGRGDGKSSPFACLTLVLLQHLSILSYQLQDMGWKSWPLLAWRCCCGVQQERDAEEAKAEGGADGLWQAGRGKNSKELPACQRVERRQAQQLLFQENLQPHSSSSGISKRGNNSRVLIGRGEVLSSWFWVGIATWCYSAGRFGFGCLKSLCMLRLMFVSGSFSCIVGFVYIFCRSPAHLLSRRTVAVASAVSLSP